MKPLLRAVAAFCFLMAIRAHPENIEEVKQLPQTKEPIVEAEESEPNARVERCTTCSGGLKLNFASPNEILGALHSLPAGQVHTQHSFEGCSSDKGCAGIKVKDGKVIERFGNTDAFKAAASSDTDGEFSFHAAGNLPFWWMGDNSPFKNAGAANNFEQFSSSSSSSFVNGGGPVGTGSFGGFDLNANPFLNGGIAKLGGSFGNSESELTGNPQTFKSSSFESSSFSSSKGDLDISKNPFFSNGYSKFGHSGSGAQAGSGLSSGQGSNFAGGSSGSAGFASNNKFGTGYIGSSPRPFTAAAVTNTHDNQNTNEFNFEQQQSQLNIDEAFQNTGNVHPHDHSGGDLQQVCAGQGYVCVHKAQCNNGVVNTNGANILHASTSKKQYCNTKTEICCRIETSSLSGGDFQGSLGVGSATYSENVNNQGAGSGLFATSSQSGYNGQGNFASGQDASATQNGYGTSQSAFGSGTRQSTYGSNLNKNGFESGSNQNAFGSGSQFGSSTNSFESSGTFGGSKFGQGKTQGFGQGNQQGFGQGNAQGFGQSSSQSFGQNSGYGSKGFGQKGFGTTATGSYGGNNGVTIETSSYESSTSSSFGNGNKYGGGSNAFGVNSNAGPSSNKFGQGNYNSEVHKSTSQSNFIETDAYAAGSENNAIYRPGAVGSFLKPGVPYLPPDNSNSESNIVSSTQRPFTTPAPRPRPTARPSPRPTSTAAPGYLPPPEGQPSNTKETVVPNPYDEGELILDQNRNPKPKPRPTLPPLPPSSVPSGCAAALKCVPIEFCTADGVMSNTSVFLNPDQEAYRVPLTDCKDETGRIGKCCRDPFYTDPWPATQIGQWVPGVFGGNDGKYSPDSRGSPNNLQVSTVRPPVTGSLFLNANRTPKPTVPPFGPNQVTAGFGSVGQKGQFEVRGEGQYTKQGQGQYTKQGQGQYTQRGQGQFTQTGQGQFGAGSQGQFNVNGQGQTQTVSQTTSGQGLVIQKGQGQIINQGQGFGVTQGSGFGVTQGSGQIVTQGQGFGVTQGQGFGVKQGQGEITGSGQIVSQGQGFGVKQGQGQIVSQGQGFGIKQGQGQIVSQGQGFGVQQGQGQLISQGQGFGIKQGQGQFITQGQGTGVIQGQGEKVVQGQGQIISQGQGFGVSQGQGFGVSQGTGQGIINGQGQIVTQGQGQIISQGQGQFVSQGVGNGVKQGQGLAVSQGGGAYEVENEFGESMQRVFLKPYNAGGQCGSFNGQKPFGNRNENEVDFAEIPWQAMVLLQTNRSLLCGGVITRPDVVITSAACVDGLDAKNVLIKGGEWKLGIDDEPLPFQIVQVKHILRHPLYKQGSLHYDSAILVLAESLRFANNIYPICLPGASQTLDAFYNGAGECIVTGWGKTVLQAHLAGAIMHSINVSLINPGECQAKISQDYPHLLEQYDEDSCVCGIPTNPINNICHVDIGSALACTTGDGHFVLRGIYSWDSGCQIGNQLAAFYKFDLEWYEWAIGLVESVRFARYGIGTEVSQKQYTQISQTNGVKFTGAVQGGSKGGFTGQLNQGGLNQFNQIGQGQFGQGQFGVQFGTAGKYTNQNAVGLPDNSLELNGKGPLSNTFSATYTEKKVFQSEPKIISYTTKPEIVTFTTKPEIVTFTTKPEIVTYTTKPEYFTFTTKPKIITYTTKPKIVTYTTKPEIFSFTTKPQYVSQYIASATNEQPTYAIPSGLSYKPSFTDVIGHTHTANCKCLEGKK